jgi:predicted DNA-binding protein (MmcQ/YjbR family)
MAKGRAKAAEAALIDYAMTFPGAWKDHPWEHTVVKVGKKVFVFFGGDAGQPDELSATVKLPISAEMALTLAYCARAGHGLGKAGWINARQKDGDDVDLETYRGWIAQSYRAVAPKKLAKELEALLS